MQDTKQHSKQECKCGEKNCNHVPQSWLNIGHGEGKLTYEGEYKGKPVYSNPSVPDGIIYFFGRTYEPTTTKQ